LCPGGAWADRHTVAPLACPGLFRHTISDDDADTHDNVDS
jgi:hypothetical protein